MADSRCGSCSAVAMETRAAALQAQIGSWKKKMGKRKKDIEKEGVFQLEWGRKVVPVVINTNASVLGFFYHLLANHLWLSDFINKCICFCKLIFFSVFSVLEAFVYFLR